MSPTRSLLPLMIYVLEQQKMRPFKWSPSRQYMCLVVLTACDCNPYGTQQNRSGCDPATGQCLCANGYSGQQCETCKIELHYSAPAYHFSSTTTATVCRPCSCDTTGSLSPVCNGDGRCSCKAGVGGYKCAHCKDTYYNLTDTGCRYCYLSVSYFSIILGVIRSTHSRESTICVLLLMSGPLVDDLIIPLVVF